MENNISQSIDKKLSIVTDILQNILTLELFERGVNQKIIAKRLHVAKAVVVEILKGVKKKK
jgi:predicted transcriptional regulator